MNFGNRSLTELWSPCGRRLEEGRGCVCGRKKPQTIPLIDGGKLRGLSHMSRMSVYSPDEQRSTIKPINKTVCCVVD